ncbi:transposase [Micromonospora sp. WMMD1274]|uniref:transposase n=1 Tax=Micromonospora sp. WMMD1274 TaxID=3404116 RepID=UPI003B92B3E7
MYGWAGGIATNVRLEEDKLLVVVEVRADGWKEMVALADGYRESTCPWAELLRDCARRGAQVPVLAVSDGAPGFCAALQEVFPTPAGSATGCARRLTSWPRYPSPLIRAPRAALAGSTTPRAIGTPTPRRIRSLTPTASSCPSLSLSSSNTSTSCEFYSLPTEQWIHLCASDPIEPTFVTVRHRNRVTQGHRQPSRRPGHGVQAHRVRAGSAAGGERTTPARPGPAGAYRH